MTTQEWADLALEGLKQVGAMLGEPVVEGVASGVKAIVDALLDAGRGFLTADEVKAEMARVRSGLAANDVAVDGELETKP
jgi:hypothetical protein